MELIKRNFGDMLYSRRMDYDFSQEAMAEWLCLSTRQYIDLENCKRIPSLPTFINIIIRCQLDANKFIYNLVDSGYAVTDKTYAMKESLS